MITLIDQSLLTMLATWQHERPKPIPLKEAADVLELMTPDARKVAKDLLKGKRTHATDSYNVWAHNLRTLHAPRPRFCTCGLTLSGMSDYYGLQAKGQS